MQHAQGEAGRGEEGLRGGPRRTIHRVGVGALGLEDDRARRVDHELEEDHVHRAALFGFGGIAAGAAGIAKILFFVFLVLFAVSLVTGLVRRR